MNTLHQLLLAIKDEVADSGGVAYVKSAQLGSRVGEGAKAIGVRMAYIRECEAVPLDVSRWSKTCSATTYRVSIPDEAAFESYLASIRGSEEPTLTVPA